MDRADSEMITIRLNKASGWKAGRFYALQNKKTAKSQQDIGLCGDEKSPDNQNMHASVRF